MLSLFAIIAVAVLIAVATRTESAKPLGLVLIGILCVVLGSRATMVLTQNSLSSGLISHVMAEDPSTPTEGDVQEEAPAAAPGDPGSVADVATEDSTDETIDESIPVETVKASAEDADTAAAKETVGTEVAEGVAEAAELAEPEKAAEEAEGVEQDKAAPLPDAVGLRLQLPASGAGEPVRYIANVEYLTEPRPEWVETPPTLDGDVHYVAVKAGPYTKLALCERDLDKELVRATKEYIDEYIGTKRASTLITYNLDEIKNLLVHDEVFEEKLNTSVGFMDQTHARLRFDRAFRERLDDRWSEIRAGSRLLQTGMGAAIVVLLLGVLFSYFRLDTATKGYFTGRLQFVAAAAILTLVAASVLLAQWIPWM